MSSGSTPDQDGSTYGLYREDVPEAVARVFDRLDGPLEVTARPEDGIGEQYEVDWHRIRTYDEAPETDGGFQTAAELASQQEDVERGVDLEQHINRVLAWATVGVVAIHGPVDIAITSLAWHLESNPFVLELGLAPWLAIKVGVIGAAGLLYRDLRKDQPSVLQPLALVWIGFLLMMGLLLILPNVVPLLGVLG